MHEGACIFATSWRERADLPNPTAAEIVDWWRTEAEVWSALANACREHLSWQERLKWLVTLQDWLRSSACEEDAIDFSHEARGTAAADSMSEGLFDQLEALATESAAGDEKRHPPPVQRGDWVEERTLHVRRAHESGERLADGRGVLQAAAERTEALRAARVWTRLAEALEVELTGDCKDDSDEDLRVRIDLIRQEIVG